MYPRWIRCALKGKILVLNSFSEEFVRGSLSASPLMKPYLFLPLRGGNLRNACTKLNVSVDLKCISVLKIDSFANRSPLKTFVPMNVFPSRSFFVRFGTLVAACTCLRGCSYVSRHGLKVTLQSPFGYLPL